MVAAFRGGAGWAGAGSHSSLHARHGQRGAGARDDVPPLAVARGIQASRWPSSAPSYGVITGSRMKRGLLCLKAASMMDTANQKGAVDLADQGGKPRMAVGDHRRGCAVARRHGHHRGPCRWRICGRICARCAWPTVPMRCMRRAGGGPNCGAIRTKVSRPNDASSGASQPSSPLLRGEDGTPSLRPAIAGLPACSTTGLSDRGALGGGAPAKRANAAPPPRNANGLSLPVFRLRAVRSAA